MCDTWTYMRLFLVLFFFLVLFLFLLFFLLVFCSMSVGFRSIIFFFCFFVLLFLFLFFFFDWSVWRWIWLATSFTLARDIFCRIRTYIRICSCFDYYIVSERFTLNTVICIALFPVWWSTFIWFAVFIQLYKENQSERVTTILYLFLIKTHCIFLVWI